MKIFHQSVVDYQIEKSINKKAKLCFDNYRKCYVISSKYSDIKKMEVLHG